MSRKGLYSKDEEEYLKQLGRIIFLERRKKKLNQGDLGDKIGLSRTQVGRMESGENATSIVTLRRIAQVLEIPLEQLVLGT